MKAKQCIIYAFKRNNEFKGAICLKDELKKI